MRAPVSGIEQDLIAAGEAGEHETATIVGAKRRRPDAEPFGREIPEIDSVDRSTGVAVANYSAT